MFITKTNQFLLVKEQFCSDSKQMLINQSVNIASFTERAVALCIRQVLKYSERKKPFSKFSNSNFSFLLSQNISIMIFIYVSITETIST